MQINNLAAETWNWLKMNGSKIEVPALNEADFDIDNSDNYELIIDKLKTNDIDPKDNKTIRILAKKGENITGVGPDMDRLLYDNNIGLRKYEINKDSNKSLKFSFKLKADENLATALEIRIKAGVKARIVEEFEGEDLASGFLAVQTKFVLEEGASLEFVQLENMPSKVCFINDIGTVQAKDSCLNFKEVILNAGKTYLGSRANLIGDASEFNAELAYLVKDKDKLDMNFVAFQTGQKTNSSLNVKGILRDEAFKIFRGTIDFIRGCKDSKGQELEDVLLLDDGVINQTIPLILCDEEDVEGDHGASIGQLDEDELFYLKSRGIKEDNIYEMLAKARLESVISKISDEEIKTKWSGLVE